MASASFYPQSPNRGDRKNSNAKAKRSQGLRHWAIAYRSFGAKNRRRVVGSKVFDGPVYYALADGSRLNGRS